MFFPGSLVFSHLPKHDGRWFGDAKMPMGDNECVNCVYMLCYGLPFHLGKGLAKKFSVKPAVITSTDKFV